jgi:penicillin-binding protein 1A
MFRPLFRVFTLLIFALSSVGAVLFFLFFYFGRGLPDYQFLRDYQPAVVSRVYTGDYQLLKELSREKRIFVSIENIPPLLVQAFLSAEDKNFYYHAGIDVLSVGRAFMTNTFKGSWGGKAIGASTITQQVAKNFLVGNERSFDRKIREAIMSMRLESALTKERILELYLNQIYLGMGSYGVLAAAQTYFNKTLDQLTISECAFLASLPKAPATYHPIKEQKRAKSRRDWVIGRLVDDKIISVEQGEEAQKEDLKVVLSNQTLVPADFFVEEVRREVIQRYGEDVVYTSGFSIFTTLDTSLQAAADTSLRRGLVDYDRRHGWRGPVTRVAVTDADKIGMGAQWAIELGKISTIAGMGEARFAVVLSINSNVEAKIGLNDGTVGSLKIDGVRWARAWKSDTVQGPEIQKVSDVLAVGDIILVINKAESAQNPIYELHQIPDVSGGVVVMDADTGYVLAMSGGYSFEISQFNCATQAWRQPGSAFKPFVYLAALEKGYTPETLVDDAPIEISLGPGLGVYAPKNITHRSYGPSPLRIGIEKSYNLMTVHLAHQIGMKAVQDIAKRFGVVEDMPLQLAASLGARETTVLRLTTAYAMIINGGKNIQPMLIKQIHDRLGQIVYLVNPPYDGIFTSSAFSNWQEVEKTPLPDFVDQREQVIKPEIAKAMVKMLEAVVQRGTGKRLQPLMAEYNVILGGKTGSTNECKDSWFVGFIRKSDGKTIVIGVFMGFPNPRSLGSVKDLEETGSRGALPIFEAFVKESMEKT